MRFCFTFLGLRPEFLKFLVACGILALASMTAVSYGLSICFLYCNMLDWKSCQKQIGLKHDTKVWCQWVCHKSKKKQNPSVQIKSVQSPDSSTQSPNHSHTHPTVPAEHRRRIIARFLNLSLLRNCDTPFTSSRQIHCLVVYFSLCHISNVTNGVNINRAVCANDSASIDCWRLFHPEHVSCYECKDNASTAKSN